MEQILEVSYEEKDEAKALGARWNPQIKKWYVPEGVDIDKFDRWIPFTQEGPSLNIKTPILLFISTTHCWKCQSETKVFCIGTLGYYEDDENCSIPSTFSNLDFIPDDLKLIFQEICPTYYIDYTKTSDSYYFVNHCTCGAKLGDFHLHSEPGAAFCPTSKSEAKRIQYIEIRYKNKYCGISGDPGWSDPNFIFKYAKKIKF